MGLRGMALAGLLALSGRAEASYCALSAGGVLAVTHGARDWDLATSGTWVRSQSPAGELSCHGRPRAPWIGVQATPTLWHTYNKLDGRYRAPVSWTYGMPLWTGEAFTLGTVASGGTAARGGGMYVGLQLPRIGEYAPAVNVRALWYAGHDDALRVVALLELERWHREEGDVAGARVRLPGADVVARQGFEVGSLVGWRATVSAADAEPTTLTPQIGLRAGVLTDLRRDVAIRPMVLGTVGSRGGVDEGGLLGLELAGGALFSGGRPVPAVGLGITVQGSAHPLSARGGVLVPLDAPRLVPDVGIGMTW